MKSQNENIREFGAFPAECVKRGIGKTVAYELMNAGLLETFKIGMRRYVYMDSLLTIHQRIPQSPDVESKSE